jgi:hypothetical protein
MKLITEINEEVKFITEDAGEGGKKNMFIEGVFMQAEKQNRNGRMYPLPVMQREVNRYINEYVNKNRAYGELGHPEGPTINLERVSHMIKELRQDGNNFIGKAKIMDTPYGNIVKNLINEGATVGVSTRGLGSLKEGRGGVKVVQDDFYLATAADIVADPSAPDAFVQGIMENREWVYVAGRWTEREIEESKEIVKKVNRKDLEKAKLQIFENFIRKL